MYEIEFTWNLEIILRVFFLSDWEFILFLFNVFGSLLFSKFALSRTTLLSSFSLG